jgi:polyisoprenoid-binding protein YceI
LYSLPAIAGVFSIDPDHAQIGFSAMHMMIYNVKGTFKQLKGEFELDESNMLVSPNVEIKTSSIDTKLEGEGLLKKLCLIPF